MERLFGRFMVLILVFCLTVGIALAVDVSSGLVGYWPLDGDAKDSVGGKDGKLVADNLKFGWDECCGADRHFLGIIDEVMIYDRPLLGDEILNLATSGLSVNPAGKLTTTWGSIKSH